MTMWPIANRSEAGQIDFFYLQRAVGVAMGLSVNPADWDDFQTETIRETIEQGLFAYYYPPPLPPPYSVEINDIHEWSFLRPVWELDTSASQREYLLPDNFERPIGTISFRGDTSNGDQYGPIRFSSPTRLLELANRQDFTSVPEIAAIIPQESTGETPQRLVLVLHPTPDATYRLQLQYQALFRPLSKDNPFPLGGQIHGNGILHACLAAAEYKTTGTPIGPAYQKFLQVLAGNIIRDTERGATVLGYNGSDSLFGAFSRGQARRMGSIFYSNATYGGNSYIL